jgi:hypothetical protein
MAIKDGAIPADFVDHLCHSLPGFNAEIRKHQIGLAWMLWLSTIKRRRHTLWPGRCSFSHQEMNEKFGRRKFPLINTRLALFDVKTWSMERNATKGYTPTRKAQNALQTYLEKPPTLPVQMLYGNGKVMRTIASAVASTDMRGNSVRNNKITRWRNTESLNRVAINVPALTKLKQYLLAERNRCKDAPSSDARSDARAVRVDRLILSTDQICRMAKTTAAGDGFVAHHYVMSSKGRLFAQGINLQTAPSPVRQAALAGLWDYDFSNCHFAIFLQMAARSGFRCAAIDHYLATKNATREAFAKDVGIGVHQAKKILLAALFGAIRSLREGSAIPDEVGEENAKRVYANGQFQAIKADIDQARATILNQWPRTRNGKLSNGLKLAIDAKKTPRVVLAHLIQGVEAAALQAALDLYPKHIVLLQHDGFTASEQLDVAKIQTAVLEATNFDLNLEEARLDDECIERTTQKWLNRSESKLIPVANPPAARATGD